MRGSCACGAVRWEAVGPARDVIVCRCGPCRRQSGAAWAATQFPKERLRVEGEVRWFEASPGARRGFCPGCGSFLFWAPRDGPPRVSVAAGSIDGPSGLRVSDEIQAPGPPPPPGAMAGACLCGAVTVEVAQDPGEVHGCHCAQCRKYSGHFSLSVWPPEGSVAIRGALAAWTGPGGSVRRFCPACGTKVSFTQGAEPPSLEAGLLDALAGRPTAAHIFTAFKGDYYVIPAGEAQHEGPG